MNKENSPQLKDSQINRRRWIVENFLSLGVALLIVFIIRSSVIEAFKIPSGSMIPTLFVGDHIFVNKLAYGFKIPFSDLVTDHPIYLIKRDQPKRGDIIVFVYPKDESFYFIKRVIGVPGDTVEVRNKTVFINHQEIRKESLEASAVTKLFQSIDDPKYSPTSLDVYKETIDQSHHAILLDRTNYMGENYGPITIPPESLFVMGDNRDFSNDSRFWGVVPMKNVKGRAMVVWWSMWVSFSDGQFIFRPHRIGTTLQ